MKPSKEMAELEKENRLLREKCVKNNKIILKYMEKSNNLKTSLTIATSALKTISLGASDKGPLNNFPEKALEMARIAHEALDNISDNT